MAGSLVLFAGTVFGRDLFPVFPGTEVVEIGARRENKKVSEQLSMGKRGVGWEVAWRSGAVTYLSKLFCFSFWKYFVQKLKKT